WAWATARWHSPPTGTPRRSRHRRCTWRPGTSPAAPPAEPSRERHWTREPLPPHVLVQTGRTLCAQRQTTDNEICLSPSRERAKDDDDGNQAGRRSTPARRDSGQDVAYRPVVDGTPAHRDPADYLAGVRPGPGGDAEVVLRARVPLSHAVLLAVHIHRLRPDRGGVRPGPTRLAARPVRHADLSVPGVVPPHLPLPPPRLLPLILGLTAGVRRARRAQEVHRRDPVSPDLPERAPVLLLRRHPDLVDQHVGRDPRVPRQ